MGANASAGNLEFLRNSPQVHDFLYSTSECLCLVKAFEILYYRVLSVLVPGLANNGPE